ncbi:collagen alpha-1(I) chain-like [Melopsittacus undulatus]|nr:collagen alpha-1(I) chain-like [Melopsittacus undulatus]
MGTLREHGDITGHGDTNGDIIGNGDVDGGIHGDGDIRPRACGTQGYGGHRNAGPEGRAAAPGHGDGAVEGTPGHGGTRAPGEVSPSPAQPSPGPPEARAGLCSLLYKSQSRIPGQAPIIRYQPIGNEPGPAGSGCSEFTLEPTESSGRGAEGPRGPHERPLQQPGGVSAERGSGPGDAPEAVTDPDMEALFDEWLGSESSPELTGPSLAPPQPRGRPYRFVLRDPEQRGLCLRGGRLVPLPLQGASAQQEEPLSAVPNPHLQRRRCPLLVGIRGGSRALACSPGPEPRLQLLDVGLLELISREESAAPCTFYKSFGGSTHTFEAAASPGAFLSTGGGHELGLAPPDGATAFYLHRI